MIKFIINLVISGSAVAIAAYFTPGVMVDSVTTAILVAGVLWFANATIGTLLRIITFPLNILSFWLMSGLISLIIILITDHYIPWLSIANWSSALLFSFVLSLVNRILSLFKQ